MSIRLASLDDIPVIRRLAEKIFPPTYRSILSPEQLEYMMQWMYGRDSLHRQIADEGHVYFLAYDGDEPVGYVSVQQESDDVYHLQKIYVLPSRQGEGIGQQLFQAAISHVKRQHPSPCSLHLNVNRNNSAIGFYKRMGMKIHSQGDFPIGNGFYMNDYIMALDI
ncbi:MAG: GNAT family N-acetyltransferase [Prevotella sp.]|nr:GNAT family N-acetyltransferase [Prevotella sp.]